MCLVHSVRILNGYGVSQVIFWSLFGNFGVEGWVVKGFMVGWR